MNNQHDFERLEIPLIAKLFEIYASAHKIIFSLPKFERYTLGEKIESSILEAVELIVIANNSPKFEKERYLIRTNGKIEILKLLYRLALNCGILEQTKYLTVQKDLQEAGKMAQGWINDDRFNDPVTQTTDQRGGDRGWRTLAWGKQKL